MRFGDPESQGKPGRICLSPWILAALGEAEGWGGEPMLVTDFRLRLLERAQLKGTIRREQRAKHLA
jgi:hypothetical protein